MRIVFFVTAGLAWLNALLIGGDGVLRTTGQALVVSLVVCAVYLLLGCLVYLIQSRLYKCKASVHLAAASELQGGLSKLERSVAAFVAFFGVFMAISLSAVISRLQEGYSVFG